MVFATAWPTIFVMATPISSDTSLHQERKPAHDFLFFHLGCACPFFFFSARKWKDYIGGARI